MTNTITLTRFNKTAGGYRKLSSADLPLGDATAQAMTEAALVAANDPKTQLQAWSFCQFLSGKMSSETWRAGTAIILEYMLANHDDPATEDRVNALIRGAHRTQLGFFIGDTQTRYFDRTISLVFPLLEPVSPARYARLASVLAAQIDQYEAASGIIAHTHLVHCHQGSSWSWSDGPTISPDSFIRLTKDEAQTIDPQQFERRRPAAAPTQAPTGVDSDDGLFAW
jgi:hypothetical protein